MVLWTVQCINLINLMLTYGLIKLKYNCQILSPVLTDNSHTSGLVGLCSFLSMSLIGGTYEIFISQSDFNCYSLINFHIDVMAGILTIVL